MGSARSHLARCEEFCQCCAISELVTSGLEQRPEIKADNFERRAAARWNLVNLERIGGKVPSQ
jgi:hypothetical protein